MHVRSFLQIPLWVPGDPRPLRSSFKHNSHPGGLNPTRAAQDIEPYPRPEQPSTPGCSPAPILCPQAQNDPQVLNPLISLPPTPSQLMNKTPTLSPGLSSPILRWAPPS